MNPLIQLKTTPPLLVTLALLCFGLLSGAQAVVPPPPGGYPNFTTAAGDHALQALTLGVGNTALGTFSLFSVTTGNFNTAVGAGALDLNTADSNTATGAAALLFNTTGTENTATGTAALLHNTTGGDDTAVGYNALTNDTSVGENTAVGSQALLNNTSGINNTANGFAALFSNAIGFNNTAIGLFALGNNTSHDNTALGFHAGESVTTANNVICIGTGGENVDNSCYIGNIFGATSTGGIGVLVNSDGKLGTVVSSRRFKEEIQPMERASETLFALKPVTFRYKKEIDPAGTSQFGLVAEDVEKVSPDLIARDKEGKPYTVRYDAVNAMLLNEFLKEHRKVEKLEATVAEQQRDFEAAIAELKGQIQKVSAQLELHKPAPQTVNNQ